MKRFTIFGRSGCGFCVRAKELCEMKGFPFKYIDIHEESISKKDIEKTAGRPVETVPQIFHGEDYIGGYSDLEAYIREQGL